MALVEQSAAQYSFASSAIVCPLRATLCDRGPVSSESGDPGLQGPEAPRRHSGSYVIRPAEHAGMSPVPSGEVRQVPR